MRRRATAKELGPRAPGELRDALASWCGATPDRLFYLPTRCGTVSMTTRSSTGSPRSILFLAQMRRIMTSNADRLSRDKLHKAKRLGFSDARIGDDHFDNGQPCGRRARNKASRRCTARRHCAASSSRTRHTFIRRTNPKAKALPRSGAKSSSSAAVRTASARASSSTTAACTPVFALASSGWTVMVNCNPETVSTDYEPRTVLYFEPSRSKTHLHLRGRAAARHVGRCDRTVRRADTRQAPCRWRAPLKLARRAPTPSIAPKIASLRPAPFPAGLRRRARHCPARVRAFPRWRAENRTPFSCALYVAPSPP